MSSVHVNTVELTSNKFVSPNSEMWLSEATGSSQEES